MPLRRGDEFRVRCNDRPAGQASGHRRHDLFGSQLDGSEAQLVAEHLVEANLRGHDSHGVGMIPAYIANALDGSLVLNQSLSIAMDSGPLVICDGGLGIGQVMARDAIEVGVERARGIGACIVGLRNSHHIGRIGHWAEQCATTGLVSVHSVNVVSTPAVVPFGGIKARVGTNPFAVAIPRAGEPPSLSISRQAALRSGRFMWRSIKAIPFPREPCWTRRATQ
jgi:uncharacterized oxidoreductase